MPSLLNKLFHPRCHQHLQAGLYKGKIKNVEDGLEKWVREKSQSVQVLHAKYSFIESSNRRNGGLRKNLRGLEHIS